MNTVTITVMTVVVVMLTKKATFRSITVFTITEVITIMIENF